MGLDTSTSDTNGIGTIGMIPAFMALRANLELSMPNCNMRHLVVVALSPDLGAAQIVLGLGHAFTQVGVDVVLADADCQQPILHEKTGARLEPGLFQWLQGDAEQLHRQETKLRGISILAAGGNGLDPLLALSSHRINRAMKTLSELVPLVIWHVPALQTSAAGELIASQADATLLAIRQGKDHRGAARRAKQRLVRARANVVGAVACRQNRRKQR